MKQNVWFSRSLGNFSSFRLDWIQLKVIFSGCFLFSQFKFGVVVPIHRISLCLYISEIVFVQDVIERNNIPPKSK